MINKNLSILKQKQASVYGLIQNTKEDDSIEIIQTRKGLPVPVVNVSGKKLSVHSRFDPVKEAERFSEGIDPEKHDLYIVFGFGFAYHIEQIITRTGVDSTVLVVERNAAMIRKAMENRDLAFLLRDERLIILVDPKEDDIADVLKGRSSRRASFLTHRGSYHLDPDYYSNLNGIARSYLSTKEVNIATLAKFEKTWSSNIAGNIREFYSNPGAVSFYGRFSGLPAIVVAAGPSLYRSLDFIRENADRAVIISVDTAYRILKKNGIEPHFCMAVDPQVINARYFEGAEQGKTILAADPTVHPSVFRLFNGRYIFTGVAFEMMKWIEKITGGKGDLAHGGSVSTNAYDFAKRLGVSSVYMVGQDLSFTEGLAHSPGSYLDEQVHLKTNRFYNVQMFNRTQLTSLPPLYIKGIRSEKVHTNRKMMVFYAWFEKRNDQSLYNLTYNGAFINGISHLNHEDVSFDRTNVNLGDFIDDIYNSSMPSNEEASFLAEKLIFRITAMLREIDSLVPVFEKASGFSGKLLEIMKKEKNLRDQNKIDYILKKLSEADAVIEGKKNIKDIISFTIQRVIHTITEGYEMDEQDSDLNDDELIAKRSLYLYNGMLEGASFSKKIFGKMKSIISL